MCGKSSLTCSQQPPLQMHSRNRILKCLAKIYTNKVCGAQLFCSALATHAKESFQMCGHHASHDDARCTDAGQEALCGQKRIETCLYAASTRAVCVIACVIFKVFVKFKYAGLVAPAPLQVCYIWFVCGEREQTYVYGNADNSMVARQRQLLRRLHIQVTYFACKSLGFL